MCPILNAQAFDLSGQILRMRYGAHYSACTQDARADSFTTTVNGDSASGQTTLNVAATTDIQTSGDVVVVNPGGAREEVCFEASKTASTIVCTTNLLFTHTAAQADVVDLTNRLPATGTTGFTAGLLYRIHCHNAAGSFMACRCIQGGTTVDSLHVVGPLLADFPGEDAIWFFRAGNLFISCVGANGTDGVIVDVCPMD